MDIKKKKEEKRKKKEGKKNVSDICEIVAAFFSFILFHLENTIVDFLLTMSSQLFFFFFQIDIITTLERTITNFYFSFFNPF